MINQVMDTSTDDGPTTTAFTNHSTHSSTDFMATSLCSPSLSVNFLNHDEPRVTTTSGEGRGDVVRILQLVSRDSVDETTSSLASFDLNEEEQPLALALEAVDETLPFSTAITLDTPAISGNNNKI